MATRISRWSFRKSVGIIVRGKHTYAGALEAVLDILVKQRINEQHPFNFFRVDVEFISRVEIVQAGLKYKRFGRLL